MWAYTRQGGTSFITICRSRMRLRPFRFVAWCYAYFANHRIRWVTCSRHSNPTADSMFFGQSKNLRPLFGIGWRRNVRRPLGTSIYLILKRIKALVDHLGECNKIFTVLGYEKISHKHNIRTRSLFATQFMRQVNSWPTEVRPRLPQKVPIDSKVWFDTNRFAIMTREVRCAWRASEWQDIHSLLSSKCFNFWQGPVSCE